jgi:hypothetical protein
MRSEALDWQRHAASGRALAARTKRRKALSKLDQLKSFVKSKDGGLNAICKHIVDGHGWLCWSTSSPCAAKGIETCKQASVLF